MTGTKQRRRVAVVTGGRQGIGRGVAVRLGRDGCDVAVLDRHESDDAVRQIGSLGVRAMGHQVDLADAAQVGMAIPAVADRLGGIDVLVNCAGVAPFESFLKVSEETWDRTLDTNLKGTFLISQAAARLMCEQLHGRIINIISNAAILGYPNLAHYTASKAGVAALTMAMAVELGPYNVTVNGVSPGTVKAGGTSTEYLAGDREAAEAAATPMRRIGEPEDIAALVSFLASDQASWITGQTITVDSGFSLVPA